MAVTISQVDARARPLPVITTAELMLIEQRLANSRKSLGIAYFLWFFLWFVGAHRWYVGRSGSALAMGALAVGGLATFGATTLIAAIWAIVDMFLIPGWIRTDLNAQRDSQIEKISAYKQASADAEGE